MDFISFFQSITITQLGMVLQLALLEGLLSFDNALALAALVSDRLDNPLDRKRALLWGIWGAYVTRILIVFIGVWLMRQDWIKFVAGVYLLWMAFNELVLKRKKGPHVLPDQEAHAFRLPADPVDLKMVAHAGTKALVKTIVAVELMDVMFSIDSVAVALAVSNEKWVLVTGAVIGILMMRVAATYFIKLIEKFPILIETAFVLVGIAGVKVVLEVKSLPFGSNFDLPLLGFHVPEWVLLPLMLSILVGALVLNAMYPEKFARETSH